jgi:hypothetical protein
VIAMTERRPMPPHTMRELNLDDLDHVVGGATTVTPTQDHSQDQAFLATLGNVAATVSALASDINATGSHAAADIKSLEAAAASAHVSVDGALTALLGATHGNADVAKELSTRLANGAAEKDIAGLVAGGYLSASNAMLTVNTAVGTVAAYSADGDSVLGMSQHAALDIVESKLDTAAKAVTQTTAVKALESTLEVGQASDLAAAAKIQTAVGGATALASGMSAAIAAIGQAESATLFGQTATATDLAQSINTGKMTAAAAITAIETDAANAHASADQGLSLLEKALGTNASVEAEMAARLVNGSAAADLAAAVSAGTMTRAAAIAEIQLEATQAHVSQVGGLAALNVTLGGDTTIQSTLVGLVKTATDATAAISGIKAVATASHTTDAALMALDKTLGGNLTIEAEMAARLANGLAATDLAATVATGTTTVAGAIAAIQSEATQARGSQAAGLAALNVALGGNSTVQTALIAAIKTDADVTAAIGAIEGAASLGRLSADTALLAFDKMFTGGKPAVETEIALRLGNGAAAADLAAAVKAGTLTAAQAITTAETSAQLVGASADAVLLAMDKALGGNAAIDTEIQARLSSGAAVAGVAAALKAGKLTAAQAIATLEGEAAQVRNSSDAALLALDKALGGNAAVQAEIAARIASGAMATDLKTAVTAGKATVAQAIAVVESAALLGHSSIDAALLALDKALTVSGKPNAAVETEMLARITSGAMIADLTAGIKGGTISPAQAIAAIEGVGPQLGRSSDVMLVALDKSLAGNAAIEAEMATRLASNITLNELNNARYLSSMTRAQAVSTIESMAQLSRMSIDAALFNYCKIGGAIAEAETELTTRLNSGAAGVDMASVIKAGKMTAADAVSTIEAIGQYFRSPPDTALSALDKALGGNAVVENEIAARFMSGAALKDVMTAIQSGALTVAAAVTNIQNMALLPAMKVVALATLDGELGANPTVQSALQGLIKTDADLASAIKGIEAGAGLTHASADAALLSLDKALGGRALLRTEMAARLASGAAGADIAAALSSRTLPLAQAVDTIQAEAQASGSSIDAALASVVRAGGWSSAGSFGDAMAQRLDSGATVRDLSAAVSSGKMLPSEAIATLEAVAQGGMRSTDGALLSLNAALNGHPAVSAELSTRLTNGAAIADLVQVVSAHQVNGDAAVTLLHTLAEQAGVTLDPLLVAYDKALVAANSDGYAIRAVEFDMLARLVDGTAESALAIAVKAGTMTAEAAVASVQAEAGLDHASQIGSLALLNVALNRDPAVQTALMAVLKYTDADITAATQQIAASAAWVSGSPTPALAALNWSLGGHPIVEAAAVASLVDSQAFKIVNRDLSQPNTATPEAITTIEANAARFHISADAALAALDKALGGDRQVEAEIASRLTSGTTVADLTTLVMSGFSNTALAISTIQNAAAAAHIPAVEALGAFSVACNYPNPLVLNALAGVVKSDADMTVAIGAIEAAARSHHISTDFALLSFDRAYPSGNAALEKEMAARVIGGASAGELAALAKDGSMSADAAFSMLDKVAVAAHLPAAELALVEQCYRIGTGTLTGVDAVAAVQAYATANHQSFDLALAQVAAVSHDPSALNLLEDRLLSGTAAKGVVQDVISGALAATDAVALLGGALGTLQGNGPNLQHYLLPGPVQAEVILAKLQAEIDQISNSLTGLLSGSYKVSVNVSPLGDGTFIVVERPGIGSMSWSVSDFAADMKAATAYASSQWRADHAGQIADLQHKMDLLGPIDADLKANYSVAVGIGKSLLPAVESLGQDMASTALGVGGQLISKDAIANPDAQAQLITSLMAAAQTAHVSTDMALTLASYGASGHSEMLKVVMTGRLMGGAAEAEAVSLCASGKLTPEAGLRILTDEVRALAAANPNQAALGFDQSTAMALVTAKYEMAAVAMRDAELALAKAGGPDAAQHQANANASEAIRTTMESAHAGDLAQGLGAVLGLLKTAPVGDANAQLQSAIAADILQRVLPAAVTHDLTAVGTTVSDADATRISQQTLDDFKTAFQKGNRLGGSMNEFSNGTWQNSPDPTLSKNYSLITSHNFLHGASGSAGTAAAVQLAFGSGVVLTETAGVSASGGAGVTSTGVSASGQAGAMLSVAVDFNGYAKMNEFVQALADGSVKAGATGVNLTGSVGVAAGVDITHNDNFNLGKGFSAVQTSRLEAEVAAGATASGKIGLSAFEGGYGARAGAFVSAGDQVNFLLGPAEVGAGATVYSPGILGASLNVGAGIADGKLQLSIDGFLGAGIAGVQIKLNLSVDLSSVPNWLGNAARDAANAANDRFFGGWTPSFPGI